MPTGFALHRPRLELTGLEEPEELWDRLKEAMAESQELSAANKKLMNRIGALERQLSEVGSLTDDELVAELPKRMGRALESAQGVAQEIVRRARRSGAAIRHDATESAAGIVREAENQAAKLLSEAAKKAASHISVAEGEASEIIGAADKRREEILAHLQDEALSLQQRINTLRREQSRLVQAYDVVERTLAEARRALQPADGAQPAEMPASTSGDAHGTARKKDGRKRAPVPAAAVFDWAPRASSAG